MDISGAFPVQSNKRDSISVKASPRVSIGERKVSLGERRASVGEQRTSLGERRASIGESRASIGDSSKGDNQVIFNENSQLIELQMSFEDFMQRAQLRQFLPVSAEVRQALCSNYNSFLRLSIARMSSARKLGVEEMLEIACVGTPKLEVYYEVHKLTKCNVNRILIKSNPLSMKLVTMSDSPKTKSIPKILPFSKK